MWPRTIVIVIRKTIVIVIVALSPSSSMCPWCCRAVLFTCTVIAPIKNPLRREDDTIEITSLQRTHVKVPNVHFPILTGFSLRLLVVVLYHHTCYMHHQDMLQTCNSYTWKINQHALRTQPYHVLTIVVIMFN